ncbi:MAG: bifunctional UDP-sugar hydrolase/5'-nucleotidase [Bacteroidia bacterium]|nr:bifunctional UDP-sugar hydrolase/5'-nucleotidase [Bacteroidia bacterium]
MKRVASIIFLFMLLSSLGAQTGKKITVLFTNDIHSRLIGYTPESSYIPLSVNDDNTIGGFARIATIIKNEKQNNEGTSLVVDAGDFLMGTLFTGLEPETGFQLRLMKTLGYDAVAIGNHEFDYGPGKLADIVNAAATKGEIPQLLLGNAVFDEEDTSDDSLEKLFASGTIKHKFVLERDGLKIGFFSLLGVVAVDDADFSKPVTFANQVKTAKSLVKELQAEKCDLIVCLSHSGVAVDKSGNWIGEDVTLAEKVKGIDVIVSGHTHTKIEKPIIVNGIPIVQAYEHGQYVGRLTLTANNGIVNVIDYSLIPVDSKIIGDPAINSIIEDQKKSINDVILKPIGMDYDTKLVESDYLLECVELGDIEGSNLGPLVADAIHSYVNNHVKTGTDISMVAVGLICDRIVPGFQTAPDIFRIMMMGLGNDNVPGYPLSRLYVTGHELKGILEIMYIAGQSTPANYCYYAGIRVDYDPGKGLLKKIRKVTIVRADGSTQDVDFSRENTTLYSIVANSYMLENVSIIKKLSKGLVKVVPKDARGNPITDMKSAVMDFDENRNGIQEGKEWLAIVEYLTSMKDVNGNGVPDIDHKYKTAIHSFKVVKSK